jgi:LacI family transcriptional regulator
MIAAEMIQSTIAADGYHAILAGCRRTNDPLGPVPYQALAEQQKADGFLLLSVDQRVHRWFDRRGFPCTILGSTSPDVSIPSVRCHDERYFDPAVRYLARLGHQRLAFLSLRPTVLGRALRVRSYTDAVKKYGLTDFGCVSVSSLEAEEETCRAAVRRLLRQSPRPTALLTGRISQAAHVLSELARTGIPVPGEVSVISGSDFGISELLHPKLTTITEPMEQMVRTAWELLLGRIAGGKLSRRRSAFSPVLTVRESTGSAARGLLREASLTP